jgi:hypothetical protein
MLIFYITIVTNVKLGPDFKIENTQPVERDYFYDPAKNTSIFTVIGSNFEGYSDLNYIPNFIGRIEGIKKGNIAVLEGKFRIDDNGYKYILHKEGKGNSVLYIKINDETE